MHTLADFTAKPSKSRLGARQEAVPVTGSVQAEVHGWHSSLRSVEGEPLAESKSDKVPRALLAN